VEILPVVIAAVLDAATREDLAYQALAPGERPMPAALERNDWEWKP
jgi:hypothetical protein